MSLLDYLIKRRTSTASVAKDRLKIIISHERCQRDTPEFLTKLQDEILSVIAKYFPISQDKVSVNLERTGDSAILELNVTMPDEAIETT